MEKLIRPPLSLDSSPQEKYDNLILTFFKDWQDYSGQLIQITEKLWSLNPNYYGFVNTQEFAHYINSLVKDELLDPYKNEFKTVDIRGEAHYTYTRLAVSFKGFNYCLSLLESGKNSNKCFVAMAFGNAKMDKFYEEGILPAIETDNPFRAIRVDKEHTENEQTINDFIIASIKQSRFCVADLTYQRNGVYFEAGYALGRGLKVIYTCLREDHKNVHFDLKTMQTILYDTPEELREALSLKIQAFIIE